jgi:hypothetical protein
MIEATGAIAPNNAPPARPRLEYWPLDRLVPSPRNARTHSAAQVAEIAAASGRSVSPIPSWPERTGTSSRVMGGCASRRAGYLYGARECGGAGAVIRGAVSSGRG